MSTAQTKAQAKLDSMREKLAENIKGGREYARPIPLNQTFDRIDEEVAIAFNSLVNGEIEKVIHYHLNGSFFGEHYIVRWMEEIAHQMAEGAA